MSEAITSFEISMREYYVYITSNNSKTLYVGVTNNIVRRMREHRSKIHPGFTQRYNVTKLVYYESTDDVSGAIEREKQIKKWRREKKIQLIETMNPEWKDLYKEVNQ
jgi:putative endonuclease